MRRRQAGDDQRAVFPGPFPGPSGDAGRAPGRGDGAGRQPADAPPARAHGEAGILHQRGQREIPQAGPAGRHAVHPRRDHQGAPRHPQSHLPLHGQRGDRQRGRDRPEHVSPVSREHDDTHPSDRRGRCRGRTRRRHRGRPLLRGRRRASVSARAAGCKATSCSPGRRSSARRTCSIRSRAWASSRRT